MNQQALRDSSKKLVTYQRPVVILGFAVKHFIPGNEPI